MDRYLDTTRTGPLYLKQKHIAELVVTAIRRGAEELGHYNLEAYVVMANHVHLLVVPYISPTRFLQSLKSYTARQANKLLGRTGEPFWQRESYDHWVRDEAERRRIISYIENNPVKAGLVNSPRKYPWSSSPWQKLCGSEKWGLPPIRPHHSPRNKVLSPKRIGWLYPIFRRPLLSPRAASATVRENGAAALKTSVEKSLDAAR